MYKFIKRILVSITILSIIYVVTVVIMGTLNPLRQNLYYRIGSYGQMFTRLKEVDTVKNVDILFLGSSHSYRGFDTRIFNDAGYKTFNLGSSFQTPIQTKYLIETYLDNLNPDLVILETYPGAFCDSGVESSLDIISNSKINYDLIKLTINQNSLIVINTLIYSVYREVVFNEKEIFEEKLKRNDDTYIPGGFVEKKLDYYEHLYYANQSWKFNEGQFIAFSEIIGLLKSRNKEFLLVQAPITPALYNSYNNNIEFDKRMKQFGNYYRGLL